MCTRGSPSLHRPAQTQALHIKGESYNGLFPPTSIFLHHQHITSKQKNIKRQLYYTRDRWDAHVFLYDATIGTEREIFQLSTYNCTGCEPTPSAFAIMIIKASLSLSLSLPFFRKNRLKNHTGRRRSKSLNTWIIFSIKTVVYIIYACVLHMCVMMMYWLRPQSVTHSSRMNGATKKNVHWFLVFHHFSFYMSCFLCVCGWLATASHT